MMAAVDYPCACFDTSSFIIHYLTDLVQLCMMAAVAAAMRGEQVTYIDTTGSFSGRRAVSVFNTLQSGVQVCPSA